MKCAACHDELVEKRGEIDLRIHGKLYIVKNVSYEECPSCGEKVLSPEIGDLLLKKIKRKDFAEEVITVPILDGTYG